MRMRVAVLPFCVGLFAAVTRAGVAAEASAPEKNEPPSHRMPEWVESYFAAMVGRCSRPSTRHRAAKHASATDRTSGPRSW